MAHTAPVRRTHAWDSVFLWTAAGFVLFGILMLSSASGPSAYAKFGDSFWFVKHQLLFGLVPGIVALLFFARLDYHRLQGWAKICLVASFALLLAVFIPGIGAAWGTSQSWIHVFGFSIQPAEIVKLTFLIFLATWLDQRGEEGVRDTNTGLFPFLALVGAVAFLLIRQPDVGGMSIIVGASLLLYFLSGAKASHLVGIAAAGVAALFILMKAAPYRAARLTTFLHPELDPRGIGYHINQALLAIGSGGFFGLGFGHSRQKFLYLPEVEGDSIFAIIAEELGFVLMLAFVAAILFFLFRGYKIARHAPDRFGQLLGGGIMCWLGLQTFVNIAGMLSLMPLTGLTLPFVSYGGTSLMMNLAAIGVMLNISKASNA
ncbi:cell division protein FtsW [Patescibacteria group bacterium]|nr:cell division protein FtsW [Patescibacteria group bacterium]